MAGDETVPDRVLLPNAWFGQSHRTNRPAFRGRNRELFQTLDAGNPPVQCGEREQETEPCQTGLRRRGESLANRHWETTVTAPFLDSTDEAILPSPAGFAQVGPHGEMLLRSRLRVEAMGEIAHRDVASLAGIAGT